MFSSCKTSESLTHRFAVPPLPQGARAVAGLHFAVKPIETPPSPRWGRFQATVIFFSKYQPCRITLGELIAPLSVGVTSVQALVCVIQQPITK